MSSHKNFCALTVSMIVGASCCVPSYAQHKMSLQSLFDLADRQNQRIKVSEVALKAAFLPVALQSILSPDWDLNRCRMANSPHHIGATALQLRPVR